MARRAWPFHDDGSATLPVAIIDTEVKCVAAAVIVADYAADTVCAHGQRCIDTLGRAAASLSATGAINRVEIATAAHAADRVEMALACAVNGDAIVFFCADVAAFDAAWQSLGVRRQP